MREHNLTDQERRAAVQDILLAFRDGKVPHGTYARLARKHECHRHTVERIWARHCGNVADGIADGAPESRIKQKSGRNPYDRAELAAKIGAVPVADRRRIERTAAAVGVSTGLLHLLLKEGHMTRRTTRIKPQLTDIQKLARMRWILTFIDEHTFEFEGMYTMVHMDEKWFDADVDERPYLLLPDEEPPARHRQSKRFVAKTMFLAAVARPRYDLHRKTMFDGKIGIWPLVEQYTAQRSSINRPAGTILTKNIVSIDRTVIKRFLLDELIPAIKRKWPVRDRHLPILIQQDNARPHVSPHDPDIFAAGTAGGWNIRLISQPVNSPDLNVLDLGFFSSIQAIQLEHPSMGVKELVKAVDDAYDRLTYTTLDGVFLSLQNIMIAILECSGDNEYLIPHTGKHKLRRAGKLPKGLTCPKDSFDRALSAVGGDPFLQTNNSDK